MINLMTYCRRIATLCALTTSLLCSQIFSQDVEPSMTQTPLLVDELAGEAAEQVYGPEVPASAQEALPPPPPSEGDELPEMPADVDVLTRGPLHEAFATSHQANPEASPLVSKTPPELIEEVPPEYQPEGQNVQWIPGYWAWDDSQDDFIWVSGLWRDVPPGRRWVPGYWDESNGGFRWVSGFWAEETDAELGYLPEPPASIDQGPSTAAPGENYFYVPGNWAYRNGRYRWLTGHWQPVVANWIWIPACYIWTPSGCIYRSGYWDYEIDYRGTCFAPVRFRRPIYLAAHYNYCPSFAINLNVNFLTHLFVRPRCGHYYYGDWYANNFVNFGYRPWVHYHSHFRNYDPLLSYYRCRRFDHRYNTVQYLVNQHRFYANNHFYRPRPTFVAQFNFVKNYHKHHHHHTHLGHKEFLLKSNYVRTYSNVLRTSRLNAERQSRDRLAANNRIERELVRQKAKYHKVRDKEKQAHRQSIDQLVRLQRERKKNEIKKLGAGDIDVPTAIKRHRTLKLPPEIANGQKQKHRNELADRVAGSKARQNAAANRIELNQAIAKARREAAAKERRQRDLDRKKQSTLQKHAQNKKSQRPAATQPDWQDKFADRSQRDRNRKEFASREKLRIEGQRKAAQDQAKRREIANRKDAAGNKQQPDRRNQLSQLANQSKQGSPKQKTDQLNRQLQRDRRTAEQNNVQRQKNQQADLLRKQRQEQSRALQQQRRSEEQARQQQRQLDRMRRSQDAANKARERQQREQQRKSQLDQQRRSPGQTRIAQQQEQARQQRANGNQIERARKAQQTKAQQDAARRSREQAQRDAARRAQQEQQRRSQEQSRAAQQQDQARKQQARRAQQEQARKAAQAKAQQDAARRAQQQAQRDNARRAQQQQAQRDAARRAQQRAQRDAARRAQQQAQRDAVRRAAQQRNRSKPSKPANGNRKK